MRHSKGSKNRQRGRSPVHPTASVRHLLSLTPSAKPGDRQATRSVGLHKSTAEIDSVTDESLGNTGTVNADGTATFDNLTVTQNGSDSITGDGLSNAGTANSDQAAPPDQSGEPVAPTAIPNGDGADSRIEEIAKNVASRDLVRALPGSDDATGVTEDTAAVILNFPLCDAAVRRLTYSQWELADAIVAECSETGDDGKRNESYAKIKAMREEILQKHGINLSFERLRKLRQVAAAFLPGRRRPGVSLEAHLEAGTPDQLDALLNSTPKGTRLTRERIRRLTNPDEKARQEQQKAERRRQNEDQLLALQKVCLDLECQRDEREVRYLALCRELGREPEPFAPVLPKDAPPTSLAKDLDQSLRAILIARGFDPTTADVTIAIDRLVEAALAQQ
jgi:hypothetical protein